MKEKRYCGRCYITEVLDDEQFCLTCKASMQRDADFERYAYRQALEDGPLAAAQERDVMDYLTNDKPGYYD